MSDFIPKRYEKLCAQKGDVINQIEALKNRLRAINLEIDSLNNLAVIINQQLKEQEQTNENQDQKPA